MVDISMSMKFKYCLILAIVGYSAYYFFGVGEYLSAKDFSLFKYPLNEDLKEIVGALMVGKMPLLQPINDYEYNYQFKISNEKLCQKHHKWDLFIIVKSAMDHFEHRRAIRQTFGNNAAMPTRRVGTAFFVGVDGLVQSDLQKQIERESRVYRDIVQSNFIDTYFNNTIKTMMGFNWAYDYCPNAEFFLFTDDDMYISLDNLLKYIDKNRPPFVNPMYRHKEEDFYVGYKFHSAPHRVRSSKWYVSLDEYPWNRWPPYISAGAYAISQKTMQVLIFGSYYVEHFRFDDIYLGIIAFKAGVNLTHNSGFYFYKKKYSLDGYRDVIASHGYGDHEELVRVWNEQHDAFMND